MKHILTTNRLTVIDNNDKTHKIESDHRNFDKICKAVSDGDQSLFETLLADVAPEKLPEPDLDGFEHELFEKRDGEIFYRGVWKLEGPTKTKLVSLLKYGMNLQPFINFLDNLYNNVSSQVTSQLMRFLDYEELPITEDGCFIAYKGIRADKYSHHGNLEVQLLQGVRDDQGRILNEEGHVIEIRRNQVNCNPNETCSQGLHVGSHKFALDYGPILATIKVNPIDVVSVPTDYNGQKLRCCKYLVVKHEVKKIEQPVSDGIEGAEIEKSAREKLDKFVEGMSWGSYNYEGVAQQLGIASFLVKRYFLEKDHAYVQTSERYETLHSGDYDVIVGDYIPEGDDGEEDYDNFWGGDEDEEEDDGPTFNILH